MNKDINLKRGDIVLACFYGRGSEQHGLRPAVVIQNDCGNKFSPTIILGELTSKLKKQSMPTHTTVMANKLSMFLAEQIVTSNKDRVIKIVGHVTEEEMSEINKTLLVSLGLTQ